MTYLGTFAFKRVNKKRTFFLSTINVDEDSLVAQTAPLW